MPTDREDLQLTEEEWAALVRSNVTARAANPSHGDPGPSRLRSYHELDQLYPEQRRDLICPECGAPLLLKDSKNGVFYGCQRWRETGCKGSMSAHRGTGLPMGVPATADTKRLRIEAHESFDQLWKTGRMKRKEAYSWMARKLEIPEAQAHIAMFDDKMCRRLMEVVEKEFRPPNRFDLMDEFDL